MAEQALNLPQIIAVLLVGFLVIRWFLSSSSPRQGASGRPRPQINPAHVEQIYQMFPQLDRRTIIWDLTQNGGSVQATTERVLSGRALAQPPPSFQPPLPASPAPTAARQSQSKAPLPDLITKFGLASKLGADSRVEATEPTIAATKQTGWSQNKNERSELMRRRKEEMILAARRKMEAQDKGTAG